MAAQQSFENHAKVVPAYHYFTSLLIVTNLAYRLYEVVTRFSVETLMSALAAIGLFMLFVYARVFALAVQDRVIRLEMRLRLQELAPDLRPRLSEFTVNQLCGLRFASDAELPGLARTVLADKLNDRKTIKRMIRDWQADLLRA